MATTPEGKVKLKLDKWLKENMPGCFRFRIPGGPFGQVGMPDYIIIYLGTPIMIEVKADESCKPTERQLLQLNNFAEAGGISCVLKGFQEHKLESIKNMCITEHNRRKKLEL